jgi:hypothetical protein
VVVAQFQAVGDALAEGEAHGLAEWLERLKARCPAGGVDTRHSVEQ